MWFEREEWRQEDITDVVSVRSLKTGLGEIIGNTRMKNTDTLEKSSFLVSHDARDIERQACLLISSEQIITCPPMELFFSLIIVFQSVAWWLLPVEEADRGP